MRAGDTVATALPQVTAPRAAPQDSARGTQRRGTPSGAEPGRRESRFAAVVLVLFLAATIPVVLRHEMWRDEVQAWLLARDVPSLGALFWQLHYEAHPALWYLLLRPLARAGVGITGVQWVALAAAAAAVYLFARLAPLPRALRALFAFGYFVVYGYSVVARSYSLTMLLLIGAVAVLAVPRPRAVLGGILLGLAANTTVYGAILAAALGGALVLDTVIGPAHTMGRAGVVQRLRRIAPTVLITAAGVLLAYAQVRTPADAPFRGNDVVAARTRPDSAVVPRLTAVWRAYAPVPATGPLGGVWEGDFLLGRSPRWVLPVVGLSVALVILFAFLLRRSVLALSFYLAATIALLLFSAFVYTGALYHHGHLFLALVLAIWIAAAQRRFGGSAAPPARNSWLDRRAWAAVAAVFAVQVAGGAVRLVLDYRFPFSAGRAVAVYLRERGLDRRPVLAPFSFKATTVAAYLGRPVREFDAGRWVTFMPLDAHVPRRTDSELLALARDCCLGERGTAVMVLDHPLAGSAPGLVVQQLASFTESIVPSEHFYLYRIAR